MKVEASCEKQRRDILLARRSTRSLPQYLPRCTKSGMYQPLQCDAEYCWCVDDSGKRVSNAMPAKRASSLTCSFTKRKRGKYIVILFVNYTKQIPNKISG